MNKILACLLIALSLTFPLTSASSGQTVSPAAGQAALVTTSPANQIRVVNANLLQGLWNQQKTPKDVDDGEDDPTLPEFFDNRNFLLSLAQPDRVYLPDILTLQNLDWAGIAGHHNCVDTRNYLETVTQIQYGLYAANTSGGACIMYRKGRFSEFAPTMQSGPIGNWVKVGAAGCTQRAGQTSIGIRLHDAVTNRTISVASVHMGNTACVEKNVREIRNWVDGAGDAKLILGDFNVLPGTGNYNTMQSLLTGSGFAQQSIWTGSGQRNYFWHKGFAGGVSNATLVPYSCCGSPTAGVRFSDHHGGYADLGFTAPTEGDPYPWTLRPGLCRDIGASSAAAWCVGHQPGASDSNAFKWTGSGWAMTPGVVNRIAVGPDGSAWAVHSSGAIFHSTLDGSGWWRLPGLASDIGVGQDGSVWIIGYTPGAPDTTVFKWNGSGWVATTGVAQRISVGPDGRPWVVHSSGQVFVSPNNGQGWALLPGLLTDIGVGANGAVWGIAEGRVPFRWNGSYWERKQGGLSGIAVGGDGSPWAVASTGEVFTGVPGF